MNPSDKIMTLDQAVAWRQTLRDNHLKLVVTNGVFDLIHRGHAQYLHDAAQHGDRLLVAINSDEAVHAVKGPSRPIIGEDDRAYLVASLACVDCVVIFNTAKPIEVFQRIVPDVYAKGGDYTEETLDREEYPILKAMNPQFVFIPFVKGRSTTNTIRVVRNGREQTVSNNRFSCDPRLNLIFSRRSIRAFQPRPVDDSLVDMILEAAMAAPSAGAADPWHFIVLKDDAVRAQIASHLPNGRFLADAPTGIVVCGDLNLAHSQELSYLLQDCSAAMENLLLAANALSLGACWLGVHPRADRVANLQKELQLPTNIIPIAVAVIGWPAQEPPARTRAKDERVHVNRF